MDYTCGVTGIAKLRNEQAGTVIEQVREAVQKNIQKGYKYFCLSFIGSASVYYAQGIHQAVRDHEGTSLELFLPYFQDPCDNTQRSMIHKHFRQLPAGAICGYAYVKISPTEDYVMVTHDQMLDNLSRMIVVSDGMDPAVLSIIKIGRNVNIPVDVITVD